MSVKVRPYRKGGWEVDIRFRLPNGRMHRERCKAPVDSKSGALRWGQDRELHLLKHGPEPPKKEVPPLKQFAPRFLDGYARANQQKPSGIASKDSILRIHLIPLLGAKRLDETTTEDVQRCKRRLNGRKAKTINNVLTVLNVLLKQAVKWALIDRIPCDIDLLSTSKTEMGFYDFDEFERLVAAAKTLDANAHLIVLLGGEAGLRCGEIMALEWCDVDLAKRQLCVRQSQWQQHITVPKSGRLRYVPLTTRLAEALRKHRHLRSVRVLCQPDGTSLTQDVVLDHVQRAARRTHISKCGVHRLRHTFCSHLAMKGAPAKAIQELAGHRDLSTTQRYMHLSPAALDSAIRLLEQPCRRGDILETAEAKTLTS